MSQKKNIHAKLLISNQCPHCKSLLNHLNQLIKSGEISELHIINISNQPDIAEALGVRSIPWLQLGQQQLTGSQTLEELRHWIKLASQPKSQLGQLQHFINEQQLSQALTFIKQHPNNLTALLALLGDLTTPMGLRIGIGALIEDLAETTLLNQYKQPLIQQLEATDMQIQMDACYYLGYTHNPTLTHLIEPFLNHANSDFQEIAQDTIDQLNHGTTSS